MTLMCAICVWHAIIAHVTTPDPYSLDKYILVVFGGGYLVAHIAFCVYIYVTVCLQYNMLLPDYVNYRRLCIALRCEKFPYCIARV